MNTGLFIWVLTPLLTSFEVPIAIGSKHAGTDPLGLRIGMWYLHVRKIGTMSESKGPLAVSLKICIGDMKTYYFRLV